MIYYKTTAKLSQEYTLSGLSQLCEKIDVFNPLIHKTYLFVDNNVVDELREDNSWILIISYWWGRNFQELDLKLVQSSTLKDTTVSSKNVIKLEYDKLFNHLTRS